MLFILPTQWLKIERIQYSLGIRKRILQISDMHVEMLRIGPARLKRMILREQPDYIFLTGDFTREEQQLKRLEVYMKALVSTGIPVYAVFGNHDHLFRNKNSLLLCLQNCGVIVLQNESVALEQFHLIGIDDYSSGHSRISQSFSNIRVGKPVIIITHDPDVLLRITSQFQYLMSGHLHGKQFNIPLFFKIKPKGELAGNGIYKGLHHSRFGPFYISKGIGQTGVNARLFVRSEVTLHEL